MAELHKFQDDVRSEENRAKPVGARYLDENFRMVRLKLSDSVAGFLRIKENSPQPDEIEIVPPPSDGSEYAPVFANGQFSGWKRIRQC